MTEDTCPRASSSDSDTSTTKQRKRRKWDQPDGSLVSAGVAVPGFFPLANMGSLARITLPTASAASGSSLAIPFPASSITTLPVVQMPLQQHAAAIVQKLVLPKIQDELIAREIVINDADPAFRYKLTKRQTQEEIQKSTGAVVITRGKYRPPDAPPDVERPLYLHISAAAHLETTAERIKAVDHAAAMVEDMLKGASMSNGSKVDHLLNTCVYLGFEPDPSLDIASRIRGPNDKFVKHIMNETGVNVVLRGRGSGNSENGFFEDAQQPLHLWLSSNDPKSLEHAKLLAENLLDTISTECGASRVSSGKVYGAVPPPPQLQGGVQSLGIVSKATDVASTSTSASAGMSNVVSQASTSYSVGQPNSGLANTSCHPHVSLANGTSYIGYGGIYPRATPLQQVALALRQSTSPATATVATATAEVRKPLTEAPSHQKDKRPQKRKFQELPAAAKGPANKNQKNLQGSEFPVPRELTSNVGARESSAVLAPKEVVQPLVAMMPPPPPRSKPPTSPPPKFDSTSKRHGDNSLPHKAKPETVPDTLVKLLEYGDDDDDDQEEMANGSGAPSTPKPFWAV